MTFNNIAGYLAKLREELDGSDSATVQDALSDAEEYLTMGMEMLAEKEPDLKEVERLKNIVEEYGTPEETASAYREVELRTAPTLAVFKKRGNGNFLSRFFGIYGDMKAWGALLYMFIAFLTGMVYFIWAVAGISLSVTLSIFIFGLPFAAFFLITVRGIGLIEGRVVEALLGVRMPRRAVFTQKDMDWKQILKENLLSKSNWMTILYMLLQLVFGVVYFTLFLTLITLGLSFMAAPVVQLGFDTSVLYFNGGPVFFEQAVMPWVVILGLLLVTSSLHLAKLFGGLHGKYAKLMLVGE